MTRDDLTNYRLQRYEIIQLREQIVRLRSEIETPKPLVVSDMPCEGRTGASAVENAVVRLVDMENFYSAKVASMLVRQKAVEEAIDALDPSDRILMRARYIDGMTWEEVADYCHLSLRHVFRVHGRCLRTITKNGGTTHD